jgi:hypothetical protein
MQQSTLYLVTSYFVLWNKFICAALVAMKKIKRRLYTSNFLSHCHTETLLFWFGFTLGSLSAAVEQKQPKRKKREDNKSQAVLALFFFQNKLESSIDIKRRRFQDGFVALLYRSQPTQETMTQPAGYVEEESAVATLQELRLFTLYRVTFGLLTWSFFFSCVDDCVDMPSS